jgi:hypothetical protein
LVAGDGGEPGEGGHIGEGENRPEQARLFADELFLSHKRTQKSTKEEDTQQQKLSHKGAELWNFTERFFCFLFL